MPNVLTTNRGALGENAREQRILLILPGFSRLGTGAVSLTQSDAKILCDRSLCIGPLAFAEQIVEMGREAAFAQERCLDPGA